YGLTQITLDASYCGVPQTRKRHIVIGMLHEKDGFLENLIEENLATSPLTMREYFGDKLEVDYYFRIPRSYNRRAVFSVNEPSITIRGVDRPIPPNYKKHPNDLVEIGPKVRALTVLERS
ncbi:DNA cytosine methyltransferase, partial [Staphylococcus equorum]